MFGVGVLALFVGMSLLAPQAPQGSKGDLQLPINGHKRKKRRTRVEASVNPPHWVTDWRLRLLKLLDNRDEDDLDRNPLLPLWTNLGTRMLESRTAE
jgi:hypothetical protein